MTAAARRARARGFTLTEVMVVVALVGILAGLAVSMTDDRPRAADAGQAISALIREAGRRAVAAGPVDPKVAGTAARTRLVIDEDGGRIVMTVELLREDGGGGPEWLTVAARTLGAGLSIEGFTPRAVLDDGVPPELSGGRPFEIRCYADGLCDGATVYLAGRRADRARLAVLPLGGSPMAFRTW